MSLANLSLSTFLLGLAALAGGLFLLQRLRVRYRERTVITTLFWHQALEEARARVLVRRFKHWLAYLFVLLIAALMWLGFADPRAADSGDRDQVILLDGSANMGRGARFANTIERVETLVVTLPRQTRRVVLCGGRPRPLLQPGEDARLLGARLAGRAPEACPATVDATLRAMITDRKTLFVVAGEAPISPATRAALPAHASIIRLSPPAVATPNAGITALGVGRSSSGDFAKVDVLCEVRGRANPEVSASIGGRAVSLPATRTRDGDRTRILLPDVPATGALLTITIPGGDALAADDTATIRLPERHRIRVRLDPALAGVLAPVLRADPAVHLTSQNPDVAIQPRMSRHLPTLALVPIATQEEAILLYHEAGKSSADVLLAALDRLGIAGVDATEFAQASGRRIAIGAAPTPTHSRGIGVWAPLLDPQYQFAQSRSFPVFIAQAVRWLAGIETEPPFVAAGAPLAAKSNATHAAHVDASGHRYDPVGAAFVPPRAGIYKREDGTLVAAALASAQTTVSAAPGSEAVAPTAQRRGFDLSVWLAASVLALLLVEWFLCRTGRMP